VSYCSSCTAAVELICYYCAAAATTVDIQICYPITAGWMNISDSLGPQVVVESAQHCRPFCTALNRTELSAHMSAAGSVTAAAAAAAAGPRMMRSPCFMCPAASLCCLPPHCHHIVRPLNASLQQQAPCQTPPPPRTYTLAFYAPALPHAMFQCMHHPPPPPPPPPPPFSPPPPQAVLTTVCACGVSALHPHTTHMQVGTGQSIIQHTHTKGQTTMRDTILAPLLQTPPSLPPNTHLDTVTLS